MLQSIHIQNYALIETLDIRFGKGFSVITGETGAGKSIMLGAIGLLLGQRADSKAIKDGATRCVIEATFDISAYGMERFFEENELEYDRKCILRRELLVSGKSRAFVNDTPAPLSVMKALGERLIDIHSQHQNLLLNNEAFQLNVIDTIARNRQELEVYRTAFGIYRDLCRESERIAGLAQQSKADEDYLRFQLRQLDEAGLKENEQEMLEQEAGTLNHAEEIKAGIYRTEQILTADDNNLLGNLKECLNTLQGLQKVYHPAAELAERMESTYIDLKELAHEISASQESVEFSPERLEYVNERLNLIYTLEQKHRVSSITELSALADGYREKLNEISSYDDQLAALEKQKTTQYNKVKKLAGELTRKRTAASDVIRRKMQERLATLGMPNVRFAVELTPRTEPGADGGDSVAFLFSANKNGTLQNLSSVASGGEIARVMLSLKALIAGATELPTIIFDEIDTGVSGEMADKMAAIMEEMGRCMQVVSITHLPQIAARGAEHYKVYKLEGETSVSSHIRRLTENERVDEIAHMLSGATLTEAAVNNARVLLAHAHIPQKK